MSNSKSASNLAIVIGGFVNGLGLVRSLGAQGRKVVVITTQPYDIAQLSRYVMENHHIPDLDLHPENLISLLLDCSERWKGAFIFPAIDEAISCLDRFRDRLDPHYTLVIPPPETIPCILNKTKMLQAAAETGISLPQFYGNADETAFTNPEIQFPALIKPVVASEFASRFNEKLFVAHNRSELAEHVRLISSRNLQGEIFELIPGPDSNIYTCSVYMDRRGEPVAERTARKLRQTPPFFGIARIAEIVDTIPQLKEQTIELLKRIRFRGLGVTEFKLDSRNNTFQFLEVNGRSVVYNSLLRKSGLDFSSIAWADYSGERLLPVTPEHRPGVWIHLHADILRTAQNWRREDLSVRNYLGPYVRPDKIFAVWSARDPKPFYAQWKNSFFRAASHLSGRFDNSSVKRGNE